jgi:hypothetical protein
MSYSRGHSSIAWSPYVTIMSFFIALIDSTSFFFDNRNFHPPTSIIIISVHKASSTPSAATRDLGPHPLHFPSPRLDH